MSDKVENFFITPLEAHFENQPTEGARETILVDMDQHTPEMLNDAVEWLKRNRQSQKTFPSPKECNKAISALLATDRALSIIDTNGPTETYGQKVAKWAATKKRAEVVVKGSFEWREWEVYFFAIGNNFHLGLMRERERWTVPARLPSSFDASFDKEHGERLWAKDEAWHKSIRDRGPISMERIREIIEGRSRIYETEDRF